MKLPTPQYEKNEHETMMMMMNKITILILLQRYLYQKDTKKVSYNEFINKELVLFSNADNERSIPSMVDGK